jgi:predicted nucleic acid-binding protein
MRILVDTNVLVKIADANDPQSAAAADSITRLIERGNQIHIVPQNAYEFWVVATRPLANNGLAMTPETADARLDTLMKIATLLPETPAIFAQWRKLVLDFDCKGKMAHDVRLVAAMIVHGVDTIITFNKRDFSRFSRVEVATPEEVLASMR